MIYVLVTLVTCPEPIGVPARLNVIKSFSLKLDVLENDNVLI
jgi:hypothetical protein